MSDFVFAPPRHTWTTWQATYRPRIRINADWDLLEEPRMGQAWMIGTATEVPVYLPWYEGGSWRAGGRPQRARVGAEHVIVVVPALRIERGFILLDGCHRVVRLKPMVLVLDWIQPKKRQLQLFSDAIAHILRKKR